MSLCVKDFIPPIFRKFYYWVLPRKGSKNTRLPPFNFLPPDIKVEWIMDIGANEGNVAIAALLSFKDSKIICFEPVSSTFSILTQKLSPFKERTVLRNVAVSDYTGRCEINITTSNLANSLLCQSRYYEHYNPSIKTIKRETVSVTKLDDIIPDLPSKYFNIVKIDVEGLEYDVLVGGKKFFAECVDIIMIEISFQRQKGWEDPNYLKIFNFLCSLDYRLINIYDVYNITSDGRTIFDDMMITQMDCVFRKRNPKKMETRNS